MNTKRAIVTAAVIALSACWLGCAGSGGTSTAGASAPMLLGWFNRSALNGAGYEAFPTTYDTVQITPGMVDLIRQVSIGVDTRVYLGTWCSDSKREVPRFLKIADQAGIPPARITLCGVDRSMKCADSSAQREKIERVPTFIFLKDGKEIGRIIEKPATTMEGDMLSILAKPQSP